MSRASVTALFGVSSFEQAYYALRTRGSTLSPVFSATRAGGPQPTATTFENLSSSGFNTVRDVNANTVTFNLNTCPNWTVGKTGKPLAQETSANRVSQQVALSAQFLAHLQFVVSQTVPMTGAEILTTPPGAVGGNQSFGAGVLMADGRVYCCVFNKAFAVIYDPVKNVYTTPSGSPTQSEGGVLMADGRVFCIPDSGGPSIYDPAKDTVTIPSVSWPSGFAAFAGGCLLPDGRVFCSPENSSVAVIYDPTTDTLTTAGGAYGGGQKTYRATLMLDGRVYCGPTSNGTIAKIYDPYKDITTTPNGTYASGSWIGTVLMADGRIFNVPYTATIAIIYDPVTDTISTPSGTYPGATSHDGGCLLPDGRIYCNPGYSSVARIYDPRTDTLSTPAGTFYNFNGSLSCVLLPDGSVFSVPHYSTEARRHYIYTNANFSLAALTGPHFNKN